MLRIFLILTFGLLLIAAVGGAYYAYVGFDRSFSTSGEDWGQFGDYFGGVSSTLLAFINILLLVYTINLRSEQLPYTTLPIKSSSPSYPFPSIQNSCSTSSTIIVARLSILRPLRDLAMVGWSMSTRMKVRLVCDALQMAVWQRQP